MKTKQNVNSSLMKNIFLLLLLISGMVEAQIVNIPDANFKAALLSANETNQIARISSTTYAPVDTNNDGEIQLSEAALIIGLKFSQFPNPFVIDDFTGINSFTNLQTFFSSRNQATINIDGLNFLETISVGYNFGDNSSTFSNLPALTFFNFSNSYVNSISVTNAPNIDQVSVYANPNLVTLLLDEIAALKKVYAWDCNISNFSISNSPLLEELDLRNNQISSISLLNSPLLKKLNLSENQLITTNGFNNLSNLETLYLVHNNILAINLGSLLNMKRLSFDGNASNNIDFASLSNLQYLVIDTGNLSVLDVTNCPLLNTLSVNGNPISNLNLSNNSLIGSLKVTNAPIAEIDFSHLPLLTNLSCNGLLVNLLDFSQNPILSHLGYENNINLTNINLKSGSVSNLVYNTSAYYNLPNLSYICTDEGDTFTYPFVNPAPEVPITSYCSFVPGGNYNTITGNIRLDANSNGCDVNDSTFPFIRVEINSGIASGADFTRSNGNYIFYTQAGSFEITPSIENPTYFNVSPTTATVNFADNNNNSATQDFCISPNGIHPDVELVISPVFFARPGFDATYQITYRNKGNQTVSGAVNLIFDDLRTDFVSANPAVDNLAVNSLSWNYSNLLPFESRTITVVFNVNGPMEIPAVNIGDILTFQGTIGPLNWDEDPQDNSFTLDQTVVGSYDPNNIICLEGDIVPPTEIGNYLHYAINFENTGTFPAENVVVKTEIDAAKFDIGSLQLMNSNFPVDARITGNKVEFIYENIQLPIGGHGHILLKIKTQNNLVTGDAVANRGDIFFDYNFPIDTGLANTVFQTLSNSVFEVDDSVSVYPNPAVNEVTITADNKIKSIQLFDAQGRIILTRLMDDLESKLDISSHSKGIYFIKIITEKGALVQKLIKD